MIRSDGSPERDFLYVEDVAGAYRAIAGALDRQEVRGQALNAGWGKPDCLREVVETIHGLADTDVEPDFKGTGNPDGEIDRQYLNSERIRELTGWEPKVGLREGLERTIESYQERLEARAPAA